MPQALQAPHAQLIGVAHDWVLQASDLVPSAGLQAVPPFEAAVVTVLVAVRVPVPQVEEQVVQALQAPHAQFTGGQEVPVQDWIWVASAGAQAVPPLVGVARMVLKEVR